MNTFLESYHKNEVVKGLDYHPQIVNERLLETSRSLTTKVALETFYYLLEKCPDVNFRDSMGRTLLMNVCKYCDYSYNRGCSVPRIHKNIRKIIPVLCDRGASFDATDSEGHSAQYYFNQNLLKSIASPKFGIDYINFWINKCPDVNCRDNQGKTPLMVLCSIDTFCSDIISHNNYVKVLKKAINLLFDKGASPDAVDNNGNNALHLFLNVTYHKEYINSKARESLTILLVQHGVSVDKKNRDGFTPLDYLSQGSMDKSKKRLIKKIETLLV
ncbi:MAG: hypothetical protein AAGG81_06755 [Chlamydiota bacterium]